MADQTQEYLRRNLLVARAEGATGMTRSIATRLDGLKRPPRWLVTEIAGIQRRLGGLSSELAAHRDELADDVPALVQRIVEVRHV